MGEYDSYFVEIRRDAGLGTRGRYEVRAEREENIYRRPHFWRGKSKQNTKSTRINKDPKTAGKIAGSVCDFDSAVSSKRHSMFIVHKEGKHAQIASRRSLFPGRKAGQKRIL